MCKHKTNIRSLIYTLLLFCAAQWDLIKSSWGKLHMPVVNMINVYSTDAINNSRWMGLG